MPASYYDQYNDPSLFSRQLLGTLPQGSNPSQLTIDQVNIAMRASPVWNQWMQAHGHDPANVHLSNSDKNGLAKTLENQGFPLPEGWEIDDSGNIREETHVGRNILIAAAIAGAAFGGYALLAAVGPEAGAGAAAGEAATAGGVEAGATAGIGADVAAGTLGTTGAAAGLGGVEAGTVAGIGADVASGSLGATLPAADVSAIVADGGTVAADGSVFDAEGNFVGNSTYSGIGTGADSGASTLSRIGQGVRAGQGVYSALGSAIGGATSAAANNRSQTQNAALTANQQNITGQAAYENELNNRARLEMDQRMDARRSLYRASAAHSPAVSPFDPTGGPKYSADYLAAMDNLDKQGSQELAKGPAYDAATMPRPRPYRPIDPRNVQRDTNTEPSTLETIGNWVGPALSTYGALSQYWR